MILPSRPVLALAAVIALAACNRPSQPVDAPREPAPAPAATPAAPAPAAVATPSEGGTVYSKAYEACMASGDAAKGVTSAMADCVVAELKIEDGRLNAAYQKVIAGLDEVAEENLRQTQRAWIAERDRICKARAAGGTIDRINIPACVLDVTIARTKQLEAMAAAG